MITCPWCEQQFSEFGFRAHECTETPPPVEGPNVAEVIALRALSMTAMGIVREGDTLYGTFFVGRSPRRRDDRPAADTSPVPKRARYTPRRAEQ